MNDLIAECRDLIGCGQSMEDVVSLLKLRGLSKVESIRVLSAAAQIALPEAKRTVHFSQAWQDERQSGEDLHEAIEKAIEDEGEPKDRD